MNEYIGTCHCGQVEVRLVSQLRPEEFRPRSDAPVVRVGILERIRRAALPAVTTNFEGETLAIGARRRVDMWTPVDEH